MTTGCYDYRCLALASYIEAHSCLRALDEIRESKGMSLEDLASCSGMSLSQVSRIWDGTDGLVDGLIDYAMEAGARFHIMIDDASDDALNSDAGDRFIQGLRGIRMERGLSVRSLARRMNVTAEMVERIESREHDVLERLIALAGGLRVGVRFEVSLAP